MQALRRRPLPITLAFCLLASACGGDEPGSSSEGTGGSLGTGGGVATGGTGTGGNQGSGGSGGVGSGGAGDGSGGATGTGGGTNGGAHGTGGTIGGSGGSGSGGAIGGQPGGGRRGSGGASDGAGGRAGATGGGGKAGGAGNLGTAGGNGGGHGGAGGRAGTGGASGGAGGTGPNAASGRVTGYGTVLIWAHTPAKIIRLQTSMIVPAEPPASGTLFLWPGIQPNGANFNPIDNGVLQPVLTWGPTCAPGTKPRSYSTWWISGQYVNTNGSEPGYTGCKGGAIMPVDVGDVLNIDIAVAGTIWTQTIVDAQTGQSVSYSIDMKNQDQNLAYFVIEEYDQSPVADVIFTNTTITFAAPDAADCKVYMRGQKDYVSVPVPSADGRTCFIQQMNLRSQT
ncbi:MAG TPA: hypothetical protein VHU40_18545 [Polyangia bacterium]|nr:hypothetical protein [Polyangia bacterium]